MRILFGGGGSGGHFYPIIAVAERVREIIEEEKIVDAALYYLAPDPYDEKALFENGIVFRPITAGKLRRYFSFKNVFDLARTAFGVVRAIWQVYLIFPDVVFGKGGGASFPTLLAARILGIPVMIHESDSVPGRTNAWAGKFARRIAISFEEAVAFFPAAKTAYTGQPIRKEILKPLKEGAHEYLKLDATVPTILILGGSQGAEIVNDAVFRALPELLSKYQIIHQVGPKNLDNAEKLVSVILEKSPHADRYRPFGYLNDLSMRMAAGISTLVVSRAGSTLFEIAAWGIPSILIPIADSNGDHQRKNAFNYARAGGCVVVEEGNLTPHVLISQVAKLVENEPERTRMAEAALKFHRPEAATQIAKELISLALEHER